MTQTPKLVVTPSPSCPDLSSLELNESSLSTNNNSQPSGCDTTSDPNSVPNRSDRPPNGRRSGADKVRWLLARTRLLKLPRGWKMGDLQSPKRSRSTASNDAGAKYDSASEQPIHVLPRFLNQSDDELLKKFTELDFSQRHRLAAATAGATENPASSTSHLHNRWALEPDEEIKLRNRYANVQAWANSRVHLKVPEGTCDFINASPISLKESATGIDHRYIATQGPKIEHLDQFWSMVLHETEEVAVVIMLTPVIEGGRIKCAQYFPKDPEEPTLGLESSLPPTKPPESSEEDAAEIVGRVTLLQTMYDAPARTEIRKLKLEMGNLSKIVWHYSFTRWSDYSQPEREDREALISLTKTTLKQAGRPENPRIIHCSAGVGRTGTFIALDHLLRELSSGQLLKPVADKVDAIFDVVNSLREQRMHMVYNEVQYHFIHEVIREQALLMIGHQDQADKEARSTKMPKLADNKPEFEPVENDAVSPQ